jgi:hypothetical protein
VQSRRAKLIRCISAVLCAAGLLFISVRMLRAARADNPPLPETIGAIEGDAISVQGPMTMDSANGQVRTILRSGSEVRVKAGQAHIELVEGGDITICGPAHFSLLKSGGGLTIALDVGTIHAHVEGQLVLTVYTAQIQAHPVAIGNGPQDALVGLDASGAMCIRANSGAVRIEQQLTGQSLLIPQNGDVSLTNGQLESLQSSPGHCACELQVSTRQSVVVTQVSALASTEELKKKAADPKPDTPPQAAPEQKEEPIYQVFMPPLHYDAKEKAQQEYDPNLIILVRRARVRPTLIFQGKVEGDPVVAQAAPPPAAPSVQKSDEGKKPADDSPWNRVRTFFHKLWSPNS